MNIANFDLNLLRAFDALMRERNVSRAAQRMALSQPAMSNALARLRDLLDDPVLVRTSQGMQPTPKSLEVELPIRNALASIEQSLAPAPDFDPAISKKTFNVATTDYVEMLLLPKLIKHLEKVAPFVRLQIHALGPDIPESELEEGIYDFAVGRFPLVPNRILSEFWVSDRLVCLVSDRHPVLGDGISIEQFLNVEHIWVSGGQRTGVVDAWLASNNLSRKVAYTTPNFLMAPHIVAQSEMLVVTPLAIAQEYVKNMALKILPMPMELASFDLHTLWHPVHASTPAHKWFREQLVLLA
jgi:DNA-binding transcriptional LysR family regulator